MLRRKWNLSSWDVLLAMLAILGFGGLAWLLLR
jgi:hypothetical protein